MIGLLASLAFLCCSGICGLSTSYFFIPRESRTKNKSKVSRDDQAPLRPLQTFPFRLVTGFCLVIAATGLMTFLLAHVTGFNVVTIVFSMLLVQGLGMFLITLPEHRQMMLEDFNTWSRTAGWKDHTIAAAGVLFALYAALCACEPRNGEVMSYIDNNYGDLPFHIGVITGFSRGANLPPHHPEYSGVFFTYPYVVDVLSAILHTLGAGIAWSVFLINFTLLAATVYSLHKFFVVASGGDRSLALVSGALIFCSAGLSWINFLFDVASDPAVNGVFDFIAKMLRPRHDYTIHIPGNYRFGNAITTLFMPQRSFLLGLPLAFCAFTLWWCACVARTPPQAVRARRSSDPAKPKPEEEASAEIAKDRIKGDESGLRKRNVPAAESKPVSEVAAKGNFKLASVLALDFPSVLQLLVAKVPKPKKSASGILAHLPSIHELVSEAAGESGKPSDNTVLLRLSAMALSGLLVGLLPLSHAHVGIVVCSVSPVLALLFLGSTRQSRGRVSVSKLGNAYNWLVFFAVAGIVIVPQVAYVLVNQKLSSADQGQAAATTTSVGPAQFSSFNSSYDVSRHWSLLGKARLVNNGLLSSPDGALELQTPTQWTSGAAWIRDRISLHESHEFEFTFAFDNCGAVEGCNCPCADGMTFSIQKAGANFIGAPAGNLGMCANQPHGGSSISIALDFYGKKFEIFQCDKGKTRTVLVSKKFEAHPSTEYRVTVSTSVTGMEATVGAVKDSMLDPVTIAYKGSLVTVVGPDGWVGFTSGTGAGWMSPKILSMFIDRGRAAGSKGQGFLGKMLRSFGSVLNANNFFTVQFGWDNPQNDFFPIFWIKNTAFLIPLAAIAFVVSKKVRPEDAWRYLSLSKYAATLEADEASADVLGTESPASSDDSSSEDEEHPVDLHMTSNLGHSLDVQLTRELARRERRAKRQQDVADGTRGRRVWVHVLPIDFLKFQAPFALWFILPNILRLSPAMWDNIKYLIVWFIMFTPLAASVLLLLFRRRSRFSQLLAVALFLSMTLAGCVDMSRAFLRLSPQKIYSKEDILFADKAVRQRIEPNALLLRSFSHIHPALLSGLRSFMGYGGHIWSHGLNYGQRERDINSVFKGQMHPSEFLKAHAPHGIPAYALVSEWERKEWPDTAERVFAKCKVAFDDGKWKLYNLRQC